MANIAENTEMDIRDVLLSKMDIMKKNRQTVLTKQGTVIPKYAIAYEKAVKEFNKILSQYCIEQTMFLYTEKNENGQKQHQKMLKILASHYKEVQSAAYDADIDTVDLILKEVISEICDMYYPYAETLHW